MKILFITLSNIGDCILTLPVLDALRQRYPQAKITCLVPERPAEIFIGNPIIERTLIFDKKATISEKIRLFLSLSKEKFDLVIDLRNSFFGAFLPAKKRISPLRGVPARIMHSRKRHLFRAGLLGVLEKAIPEAIFISRHDREYIENILSMNGLTGDKLAVFSPGARSQLKCWDKENFLQLSQKFINDGWQIILVGDKGDQAVCSYIKNKLPGLLDLSAKTSIGQLAELLKKAKLLVTNDSAVMHLASYLNVAVAGIFGPTNELRYGPWSEKSLVVKKDIHCRPCEKALCRFGNMACLTSIKPRDAYLQIKVFLSQEDAVKFSPKYKRILILRTDRIGDVLLSTPVIKALRDKYQQSYLSMAVGPLARDILDGNPFLDEFIIYDKDNKHKGWLNTLKFARKLKRKKFDLAINLHPTNRTNLLIFLAGIPERLGYDRKLGFLLTLRKSHDKQEGRKHEAEYNLDLINLLDIAGNPQDLFMPLKRESEEYAESLLKKEGIGAKDKILAVNPGASCLSKLWPPERFALVCKKLSDLYNFKILILAGPKDINLAGKIEAQYAGKTKLVNLAGKTSLSQMASFIKRCALFISNDSGPVHIAAALGTPVISIFGRNQPGLSPKRWGPLGKNASFLHKPENACTPCLAHNCGKNFACIKAINVEDVFQAAEKILRKNG